jgi:hypothetical protein
VHYLWTFLLLFLFCVKQRLHLSMDASTGTRRYSRRPAMLADMQQMASSVSIAHLQPESFVSDSLRVMRPRDQLHADVATMVC